MTGPITRGVGQSPKASTKLDREAIVAAALDLVDASGLEGLSTRKLAAELNIRNASLYWHFKNKSDLLGAMSEVLFVQSLPLPPAGPAPIDWKTWLADGARGIRRTALSRRDGAMIMAHPRARPPQSQESFANNLRVLTDLGLSNRHAIDVLQSLRRYAIGSALQEQSDQNEQTRSTAARAATFEFGLNLMLDGLEMRIAQGLP